MVALSSPKHAVSVVLDQSFPPSSALYIGTGGTLTVQMESGSIVTFLNVPSGIWFPIKATQVNTSGTTASNIVAGYF